MSKAKDGVAIAGIIGVVMGILVSVVAAIWGAFFIGDEFQQIVGLMESIGSTLTWLLGAVVGFIVFGIIGRVVGGILALISLGIFSLGID